MAEIRIESCDEPEILVATAEYLMALANIAREPVVEATSSEPLKSDEPLPGDDADSGEPLLHSTPQEPPKADEVDINGLPWDYRIHASTKTKTTKGAWKKRKGVGVDTVEQVEAELRDVLTGSPDGENPPVVETLHPDGENPFAQTATPGPTPAPEPSVDWPTFLQKFTAKSSSGGLDIEALTALFSKYGVEGGMPMMANRPELFDIFITELGL